MKHFILTTAIALSVAAGPALANEKPGEGVTVRPVINHIAEEYFWDRIIFSALESLGYTIAEPQEVQIQTAHLALRTGDGDFFPSHSGELHRAYFEEAGGEDVVQKLGPIISGQLQGYLIDKASYDSGIQNLGDLKDPAVAAKFDTDGDGKADLAGCAPGWGCERVIEHHLTEYALRDTITHNQGEYNALIADVIANYKTDKPVFYYTWTPYWVSGVLVPGKDVEWLSVPYSSLPDGATGNTKYDGKNLGFAVDDIYIVARKDFLADNPSAAVLFESMKIDINDVAAQNLLMVNGEDSSDDIDRHVAEWIAAHRAEYESWLEAARAAAN